MATIVKEGNKHKQKEKISQLHNHDYCGSLVEFTTADIQIDLDGGRYVECPVCKVHITAREVFTWGQLSNAGCLKKAGA